MLSVLLLQLLAERESYGYEVVQRLHEVGLTDVLEGTVYPALSRLEREGRVPVADRAGVAASSRVPRCWHDAGMTGAATPSELAHEYGEARRRMSELVAGASDATIVSTRIPACPEWTVHALCSHVTGIAADLTARRNPGPDVQAWVDGQIAERADRQLAEVLAEWAEVGPQFEALIERKPAGFGGLLYDLIAHEHDLRGAIGAPGARDSAGLVAAMEMGRAMLERDLASHGLPAVRLAANGHEFVAGESAVELTLDLGDRADGTFELFRSLGSRRSRTQLATLPWQGDLDRFLPALAHMPLPDHDLVE